MTDDSTLALYRIRTATKYLDEIFNEVMNEQEMFFILVTMMGMHLAREYDMTRKDFDGFADNLYDTYCAVKSFI